MMFLYPTNWVVTVASPPISLRILIEINPLSANPTKWPNTLKQFFDKLPTNCLSVFDHFVGLALKGGKLSTSIPLKLSQNPKFSDGFNKNRS